MSPILLWVPYRGGARLCLRYRVDADHDGRWVVYSHDGSERLAKGRSRAEQRHKGAQRCAVRAAVRLAAAEKEER